MLLKGKQATDFARKPKPSVWAVLAFGEDAFDVVQILVGRPKAKRC